MDEISELKKQLDKLEKVKMRENCFNNLEDFIFYFDLDNGKEDIKWTKDEKVILLANLIKEVLEKEKKTALEYYNMQSEYSHLVGSILSGGHTHTHSHGDHTHTHSHGGIEHSNVDNQNNN